MTNFVTINQLLQMNCSDFSALHGTSSFFLEKLSQTGKIQDAGNFENYFYVLIDPKVVGVDVVESAAFYAEMNAIKDLLISEHSEFIERIKNVDPYLFTIGLSTLDKADPNELPAGFEQFSDSEIETIKSIIEQARIEDRQGMIIYFNEKFTNDFVIDEITDTGQARVKLTKPITIEHICGISMLGGYEKQLAQKLLQQA